MSNLTCYPHPALPAHADSLDTQPHCSNAKRTLKEAAGKGAPEALVIELDQSSDFDMDETQDYLLKITGARSVPRIFMCAFASSYPPPMGLRFANLSLAMQ